MLTPEQFARAAAFEAHQERVVRLQRMRQRETGDARDLFVDARVVLHGARAEGVEAGVDGDVQLREAREVADDVDFADFDLVRLCEGKACVLWFYDRTKGHRRRWCTSTGCGNRAKVAAFRARASQI